MSSRRIAIIGAGAVGLPLAGNFIEAGHSVTVVARGKVHEKISQEGFSVIDAGYPISAAPAFQPGSGNDFTLAEPGQSQPLQDVLVIATKADGLTDAAHQAMRAGLVGPKTFILPAINGLPPWFPYKHDKILPHVTGENKKRFDRFARIVPLDQVLGFSVGFASDKLGLNVALRSAGGIVEVGSIYPNQTSIDGLAVLLSDLSTPKCRLKLCVDIRESIWQKLILNAFVNAWGCFGWPLRALQRQPELKWGWRLSDELHALGKALGVARGESSRSRLSIAGCVGSDHTNWHVPSTWSDVVGLKTPEYFAVYGSPLLYLSALNQGRARCAPSRRPLSSRYLKDTYDLAVRGYLAVARLLEARSESPDFSRLSAAVEQYLKLVRSPGITREPSLAVEKIWPEAVKRLAGCNLPRPGEISP